ncbi:phosphate ABC transporter substrate-binding protein PstS [Brooklawnia cerclae]|uniref:Phosphate transport system substrate-binding protein n=1 Tax=Brooklawnia cerclae TaxID=349934 RepID=A0ABX0SF05_9ACTN|nr:phosphate ABC transporter substrate-binding protein PstS [Brooklawnia cerclae]NIH55770.1 phosphate transport system substrate-binding protein [Brooklawnia cerclae]
MRIARSGKSRWGRKTRLPRPLRLLVVGVLVLVELTWTTIPAAAVTYDPITGSGSTWSQNALDQWRSNVANNYAMTVNYSGMGSTSGRRDFIDGTVDFAISEIPFQAQPEDGSAPEVPRSGYAYMPIVAGGTSFMYNLKINGKRVTNLRLSGETITKIFAGAITNWNDPAIQADNPGLAMPDRTIVPVIRSDGSGTSAQFTLWMSKQYPQLWTSGMTSQFPLIGNAKAQKGSDGVSGYVKQDYGEGAITYVEYSYAKKAGFPVVKVLNNAGYYVEPTASSVAVALLKAQINQDPSSPDYLTQILDGVYNNTDSRTYPLSSYSYMIVPTEVAVGSIFNTAKGNTLGAFTRYVLCEGQKSADTLGYSPLPMNLVMAGSEQIKRIPGAGDTGIDFNSCNNPTFAAGDSPDKNQLAETAPYPADCDKQGPNQCTTGTGGATDSTDVTGSGSGGDANAGGSGGGDGGSGSGGTGGTGGGTGGGTDNAADTASDPVYDEYGNLVAGGDSSSTGGSSRTAVSSPFTLPDTGGTMRQWLLVASAMLLIGAVVVPPLVFQRLQGGRGHATAAR